MKCFHHLKKAGASFVSDTLDLKIPKDDVDSWKFEERAVRCAGCSAPPQGFFRRRRLWTDKYSVLAISIPPKHNDKVPEDLPRQLAYLYKVLIIICVGEAYLFDRNGHWLSLFREFFGASTTAGGSAASHHCTTRYRLSLIPPHNICHNRLHTAITNDS